MEQGTLGRNNVGTGLVDSAADIKRMHPIWQAEMIEAQTRGEPGKPFDAWLKASGRNTGALPR